MISITGRAGRSVSPQMQALWREADEANRAQMGTHMGEWVPRESILVRVDLLPRERVEVDAVSRYAEMLDDLPAIVVQRKTFVLVDGRHRLIAAERRGDRLVRITERDLDDEELVIVATRANTVYGVPLTRDERMRQAVRIWRINPDFEWKFVAEVCGISRSTAYRARAVVVPPEERPLASSQPPPEPVDPIGMLDAFGDRLEAAGVPRVREPDLPAGRVTLREESLPVARVTMAPEPEMPAHQTPRTVVLAEGVPDWIETIREALPGDPKAAVGQVATPALEQTHLLAVRVRARLDGLVVALAAEMARRR